MTQTLRCGGSHSDVLFMLTRAKDILDCIIKGFGYEEVWDKPVSEVR